MDWYIQYSPAEVERGVKLPNNQTLDVIGTGTVEIEILIDGTWCTRRMENVRYAPKATVNLFSLGTLTNKGFNVLLVERDCIVTDQTSNEIIARGVKDDNNLIRMLFRTKIKEADSCLAVKESGSYGSLQQWHRRLGHINIATIKSMVKNDLVSGVNLSDEEGFFCEERQIGKMQRSSHPLNEKRIVRKGECYTRRFMWTDGNSWYWWSEIFYAVER